MRVENLVTEPIKKTYKYGVYGAMAFVGLSLSLFILWSFTSLGYAALDILRNMV